MRTLAENVARVKADFKSIKDMAHRTIGSYLDNVPTSEYAERMENGITSNYDNCYYSGMEQGRAEGYTEGYSYGKADGLAEGGEKALDDLFCDKTDWSYFNYYGKNTDILAKLSPKHTRNGLSFNYFCNAYPDETIEMNIDTSNATELKYMFYNAKKLTAIPDIDCSNVTTLTYAFCSCEALLKLPVLNTGKVKAFDNAFYYASALTNVTTLDTSSATSMYRAFYGCAALKEVCPLNTNNVTEFTYMFNRCTSLETIREIDFSSAKYASDVFTDCTNLKTINVKGTIGISGLNFQNSTELSHDSLMSIYNALANKKGVSGTWKLTIGSTNLAKLSDDEKLIATNKGWTVN